MLAEKTFDTGAIAINLARGPANGAPFVLLYHIGHVPRTSAIQIKGADHAPHEEQPTQLLAVMEQWLAGVS